VENGTTSWQPNSLLQKLESDLALLPIYFAGSSDYVIVNENPSNQILSNLNKLNIDIPKFLIKSSINNFTKYQFVIEKLLPWGWSPAEHKLLNPLKEYCSDSFKESPVFNWKSAHRALYSKKFALKVLNDLHAEIDSPYTIKKEKFGKICYTKQEVEELLQLWNKLMVKAPWSSSGRGLQPITKTPVHDKVWEKITGIIRDQGYVIVEPYFNKVFDLALQFIVEKREIKYIGTSKFVTDKKGQYQGNFLNGIPKNLSPELKDFIEKIPELIVEPLIKVLEKSELVIQYEGNFGVDSLICCDENNDLKINPCLEINVRQNMGLISLHLEQLIHPNKPGMYRTYYNPKKSFSEFVFEMETKFPLEIANQKIIKGFFPLTDFNKDTMFGAYILTG
jgi:hypothetical protein